MTGKTNCGESTFVQKLGINNFFSKPLKVECISYIQVNKNRDAEIQTCFLCLVQFHYPRSLEDLNDIIEDLKNISTSRDEQNDQKFRDEHDLDTSLRIFFGEDK